MAYIKTLYENQPSSGAALLIPELQALYDGNLFFAPPMDRPFVYSNFVVTLDGVVSYNYHDFETGNTISDGDPEDHLIMGILRSVADCIIWGSGSYKAARKFPSTPEAIWPKESLAFRKQRKTLGLAVHPTAVLVTASGHIPLDGALIADNEQNTIILTSEYGAEQLKSAHGGTQIIAITTGELLSAAAIRKTLWDMGFRSILFEGGPTLFGDFLSEGVIDEMFQTISPRLAGSSSDHHYLRLVENCAFRPENSIKSELVSVKTNGAMLFTRYKVSTR